MMVAGVEVSPVVPILVGFGVSLFVSTGGLSGAFLLVPFQVSVLGFASPAVSPTTLVYNIVAIPGGAYRYARERRMLWPLTAIIVAGALPGMAIGVILRIEYLPDPARFKVLVGCVLLYVAGRLLHDLLVRKRQSAGAVAGQTVRTVAGSWRRITYEFHGERHGFSPPTLLLLSAAAGVVSGAYGIGGGAIVGPLLVAVFALPVHTIAGSMLLSTWLTSAAGVVFYVLAAAHYAAEGVAVAPDWRLGGLFGIGGAIGMYLGARWQKHVPASVIKLVLVGVLLVVAARYVGDFFW